MLILYISHFECFISMKALFIIAFFLLVWALLGRFAPFPTLILTYIVYPLVVILSSYSLRHKAASFVFVPFGFMAVLLNDYLFKIFGGGIHDDAGRGWCELVFYLTLVTTVLAMLAVVYELSEKKKLLLVMGSFLVCGSAALTYAAFVVFNVQI